MARYPPCPLVVSPAPAWNQTPDPGLLKRIGEVEDELRSDLAELRTPPTGPRTAAEGVRGVPWKSRSAFNLSLANLSLSVGAQAGEIDGVLTRALGGDGAVFSLGAERA